MTIIHKSIRIIDYEAQQVAPRETPETFDTYVSELINHISNNTSVREYKTRSNATEVIGCVLAMCANQDDEDFISDKMNIMAHRLLLKETEAQRQIHRTKTTVQKGSLVQALLFDEAKERYEYLLAKVEHTEWVDDSDFTFKTGFSKDKKTMWKSCLFDLSDLAADEFYAKVYSDTKAQYWSNGFLELDEMNSDESNTQRAFQAIDAVLGHGFRGVIRPDHTIIRNHFIGYFKNNEYIDYPSMVNSILENYQPVDTDLTSEDVQRMSEKIQSIRIKLLELPEKKKFDSQFNVVNSAINARIRRVYPVNDGIDLKVTRDITDLSSTIQSIEENGVRYIKVRTNNDETYRRFRF
mgnify:FL=1